MIDHKLENLISLREAAGRLPRRRAGRPANVSTLYRWSDRGVRGIRLETIQIGGSRCTSEQALDRFFNALSRHREPISEVVRTKTRKHQIDAAECELKDAGL